MHKQRRWLIAAGIATLAAVAGFLLFASHGVEEVDSMQPWPGLDTSPEKAISLDLQALGLTQSDIQDARTEGDWMGGNYEKGALVAYQSEGQEAVLIWALRYSDFEAASGDYFVWQSWASSLDHCSPYATAYRYFFGVGSGTVHCGYSNAYRKVLWKDQWIVDIVAWNSTQSAPEILVDKVRDALAAYWHEIEPLRP
jgi:hypothetical protein